MIATSLLVASLSFPTLTDPEFSALIRPSLFDDPIDAGLLVAFAKWSRGRSTHELFPIAYSLVILGSLGGNVREVDGHLMYGRVLQFMGVSFVLL